MGVAYTALVRAALVVAAAIQLAGCALLPPQQPLDSVVLKVGSVREQAAAQPYAPIYAPYAVIASKAYEKLEGTPPRPNNSTQWGAEAPLANALLARDWRYVEGATGPLVCPQTNPYCNGFGIPIGGLEYQVWARKGAVCSEVVIAFRGTDFYDFDDWLSNLRWFTFLLPIADQYTQVRARIGEIVARIERYPCFRANRTVVAAIGHSLGGGLAQQAAYETEKIRYVYAFDPSPVTGFFNVNQALRDQNVQGLPIDQVYELGEILSYIRYMFKGIFPPRPCDPQVREVRFNAFRGSPIAEHKMVSLTKRLLVWNAAEGSKPLPPLPVPTQQDRIAAGCEAMPVRG